jgi:hypothetical protein
VGALHSRRLARTVQQVASQWQPDVIQIEHDVLGYCVPYVESSGAAKVLVNHDPGAAIFERPRGGDRGLSWDSRRGDYEQLYRTLLDETRSRTESIAW